MQFRKPYAVIEKKVGETPLEATEAWRARAGISLSIPLAYAGRLDPLASGLLLILIGDECKKQKEYHHLDKEYIFEVLFGFQSDTGDVLGIAERASLHESSINLSLPKLKHVCKKLLGAMTLPYPKFSSKTIQGKPLHVWTLEKRLHEIVIPSKTSILYSLTPLEVRALSREELKKTIFEKINSVTHVTEESKKLGRNFRRNEIRAQWNELLNADTHEEFVVGTFRCIASSGMYMRSLAEVIAKELGTMGLAYSIHRTTIGRYKKVGPFGFWFKRFR